jgi:superoxide dismutase, Fe-Mn family
MTKQFEEHKFNIPELKGISKRTIEEHLKLYAGYVKNANTIVLKIDEYAGNQTSIANSPNEHVYALGEIQRRFAFEFGGIRNHEYYFSHLEGGPTQLGDRANLRKAIEAEWGQFENWLNRFKNMALTRGVGWAILYHDRHHTDRLLNTWVDEQHLGHLVSCQPILALDMWEHSYLFDYTPAEKKKYVEAFFENLNWQTCEKNFGNATPI